MRLSTDPQRDEARAIAVLHAALDAGVTFFDTANAYCLDDTETGHNERLIARALASWTGDRSRLTIATKGGLTRPDGRWVPDGRARHLTTACEASLRALDVQKIDLYQLHAIDPRVALSTSVRALAALKRQGLIAAIGLCNVTVGQIEEARRITEIDAVQVEVSIWHDDNILSGVLEYCITHGIRLLAHRPLGGVPRRRRTLTEPVLCEIAARHHVTPFDIALAWLLRLSPVVVPLPGATQLDTAKAIPNAYRVVLSDADREQLGQRFGVRSEARALAPSEPASTGDVVLIMGLPGAGKSTLAADFVRDGYARVNRDDAGGSLRGLLRSLDDVIAAGSSRIVLDNTYVSRKSRAAVINAAHARGLPVRCVWLATSLEDAQVNAAWRAEQGIESFAPTVQFRYNRELEPPSDAEGFARIDIVPFTRTLDPSFVNRALIVWCDDVLLGSDGEVVVDRGDVLRRYQREGWRLLGLSWQPGIADGTRSRDDIEHAFARMREALGIAMDVEYCPHPAGPPTCWCRKPLPGLGVRMIQRYHLDPAQCIYVGASAQDPGLARRLGFQWQAADRFFR